MKPTSWPGRIGAVSDNATHSVTYGYLDNAGLVETQTHQRGSTTIFSADKDFDGLNRLTKIDRTLGTQTVAYGYETNLADQRTKMTKTTNATEDWRWNFGYDGLGSRVAQVVVREKPVPMGFVAINDVYAKSGKPDELLQKYGLTAEAIQQAVNVSMAKK